MNTQDINRNGYLIQQNSYSLNEFEDLSPQERYKRRQVRKKKILTATIVGISVCVISCLIKYIIGILSNSLAIESDAVSSLTESYSYIISTIGVYIAHKKPDREHPNGYGRIEFLTTIVCSVIILITGWHYVESSFRRIMTPEDSVVTTIQLVIIGITVFGKLYLFFDDRKIGRKYNAPGLVNASRNALLSSFSSILIIVAAVVYRYFDFDIDGWVGLFIALLMVLTGINGFIKGIETLLGKPVEEKTAQAITQILMKYPPIIGVYDLKVYDNGAGLLSGTVNAEVPASASAEEIYIGFRKAKTEVYRKVGIDLTIGILTVNYCNKEVFPVYEDLLADLSALEEIKNIHGFNWDKDSNDVDLHVIVDYNHLNDDKLEEKIHEIVRKYIPDANILTEYNVSYSDIQPQNIACKIEN